jgi:hypothetical protein
MWCREAAGGCVWYVYPPCLFDFNITDFARSSSSLCTCESDDPISFPTKCLNARASNDASLSSLNVDGLPRL